MRVTRTTAAGCAIGATWPASASTSRVRLGQMCTCMGYRNPALLGALTARVRMLKGERLSFDEESKALYDAVALGAEQFAERLGKGKDQAGDDSVDVGAGSVLAELGLRLDPADHKLHPDDRP